MTDIKITDEELKALIAEAASQVEEVVKAEEERLAKASSDEGSPEGTPAGEETPGEKSSGAGSPSPDAASADPAASAAPVSPDAAASPAPPSAGPAGDPSAAAGAPGGDPAAAGPADPAQIEQAYLALPYDELVMHYQAAKKALWAQSPAGPGAGDPAAASPAPAGPAASPSPAPMASAAPSPSPAGSPPPFGKGEIKEGEKLSIPAEHLKSNGGKISEGESLGKSEAESALEKKLAEAEARIDLLTRAVDLVVTAPQRKAVTGVSFLEKKEETKPVVKVPTDKAVITARLSQISATTDLKKSDRELINGYYEGFVKIDNLAHLFQDQK